MIALWLATGVLAKQQQVARPRGDDAFFATSGQSRRFFYDKQIDEFERAAERLAKPGKTRAKRAAAVVAAFEPINLPSIAPPSVATELRSAVARFKSADIDAAELRELVMIQAETMRRHVRRRNDEAAIMLLLS